jgi:GWxTD domain-containing protein
MNNAKLNLLLLSLIFTTITFPQDYSKSSDHPESQNFKYLYSEMDVFQSANDTRIFNYTFRIPYNHLVFVKDDNSYNAGFTLAVEITDSLGNFVDRQIKEDKIKVKNYQETDSYILSYQGFLTFHLPKGNYSFLPIITDNNSRDELKLKKITYSAITNNYNFLLPPLVINSKKNTCGNQEKFVLTNYEGFVPFSKNSYDLLIPVIDTSITNLRTVVINNEDTVFNGPLTQSSVFSLNYQVCDSQIVTGQSGEADPTRNFILKDLCNRLIEGNLTFLFFRGDEQKPFVTHNGKCLWFDKPFSLMNPEFAIKILKYMTTEDEINKILDVKEKNYLKELYKFWKKYDPTPSTQFNEVMSEYYKRVDYSSDNYSALSNKKGFDTDRGRIYIMFGKPKRIERGSNSDGKIVETWYYDQKKKFIFVDKQGTGEFSLQN